MNILNQKMCCLAILILFLSGLCVDDVKAESLSASESGYDCQEVLGMEDEFVLTEIVIDVSETYIASAYYGITRQNAYVKRSLRILTQIIYCAIDLNIPSNFTGTEEAVDLCLEDACTVVVNYIHNTDGKKRI